MYQKYRDNPTVVERQRKRSAIWKKENPERFEYSVRCATLRKKYGITADEFEQRFDEQQRKCLICDSTESKGNGRFHVDHCHTTGAIRGILCQACNVTLGKMNDDPALLRKAADYLENYLSRR